MPRYDQHCLSCHWEGEIWAAPFEMPPCPVCGQTTERLWRGRRMIVRDEIPGGLTVENYGPHPVTFYSHSERRRYMKEHGLVERAQFCPVPGTDRSAHGVVRWDALDPYTLEAARYLVMHRSGPATTAPDSGHLETMRIEAVETQAGTFVVPGVP